MPEVPEHPQINNRIYNFCVRAFGTTKKLLKLNIKLHQDADAETDTVQQGDIFLFNHFARFETFIPQYLIHEATGAYCRSVASAEFFEGDERFSQFLYSIGVVPNNMPNLFPRTSASSITRGSTASFPAAPTSGASIIAARRSSRSPSTPSKPRCCTIIQLENTPVSSVGRSSWNSMTSNT
jgi:hypothetical protein